LIQGLKGNEIAQVLDKKGKFSLHQTVGKFYIEKEESKSRLNRPKNPTLKGGLSISQIQGMPRIGKRKRGRAQGTKSGGEGDQRGEKRKPHANVIEGDSSPLKRKNNSKRSFVDKRSAYWEETEKGLNRAQCRRRKAIGRKEEGKGLQADRKGAGAPAWEKHCSSSGAIRKHPLKTTREKAKKLRKKEQKAVSQKEFTKDYRRGTD